MPGMNRSALMDRFHAMVRDGKPILGGGAGTGLSAKCEEAGGIDLIVIYNSGRYRMAGRGSLAGMLAYGNANEIVVEMAREVLPVVRHTPVLAGVNGTDPFCNLDYFLDKLMALGFSGVQNFPTVGLIDGTFRTGLEETGMGYGLEVEMIRMAHGKDLLTTPYVFNPDEARAMAEAGADILVAHMGLTTGGSIGAGTALSLDDCIDRVCRAAGTATASTAHPAWNGCRANVPSSTRQNASNGSPAEQRKRRMTWQPPMQVRSSRRRSRRYGRRSGISALWRHGIRLSTSARSRAGLIRTSSAASAGWS
jgi:predicted TIM-barrel enzyme